MAGLDTLPLLRDGLRLRVRARLSGSSVHGAGVMAGPGLSEFELIAPLWRGSREVTMTTKNWQRVLLYYGADYIHMVNGHGCKLVGRSVGAGCYSVRFVESV